MPKANWANCLFALVLQLFATFSPTSNAEVAQVLPEEITEEVAEVIAKEGQGEGRRGRGGSAGARARPSSPRKGGYRAPGVAGWLGSWSVWSVWMVRVDVGCL